MIFVYILLGLIVFILALSTFIAFSIFKPKKWSVEESYQNEVKNGNINEDVIRHYAFQDVEIINDNLKLKAKWLDNNSDKTIVFMHGHTFTLYGSYKYMQIFIDQNFNILMPDQRYHGNSQGKFCTLGWAESNDLRAWVKWVKQNVKRSKIIGVHGESMGGATVLLASNDSSIDFVISDCAFSDFVIQTKELLWSKFKIFPFMVYPTALISRLVFGIPFAKIKPITKVKNIDKPIMLIHGENDRYINISHCLELNKAIGKSATVYLCKNADHAKSYSQDKEEYRRQVLSFLKENMFIG